MGVLADLSPERFPYAKFALALAIGAFGGWIFVLLRLPLPWMLGAMTACTAASVLRAPVAAPKIIRPPMSAIVGVLLGSGFSPELIVGMPGWLPTLAGMVVFLATAGLVCVTYFRVVGGLDRPTAYFAGMPGGLVEMTLLGEQKGGDARAIALAHSARVLLLVLSLPLLLQYAGGFDLGTRARFGQSIFDAPAATDLLLVGCAFVGAALGLTLRFPAPYLVGPMALSATLHVAGITDFKPPLEVVTMAQLVLGTSIGCGFAGTPPRHVLKTLAISAGATAILLALTILFAFGVSRLSGVGVVPLILAYSPGGLAEMSLIALTLHMEVAFVAFHHIARLISVVVGAALFFRDPPD